MYPALLTRQHDVQRLIASHSFRLIRPVVLAGAAVALLFLGVDHTQPITATSAFLGILLLCAVLTRQVGQILQLQMEVSARARQLSVVSEVVSALNASNNVGSTLALALDRLVCALDADAGAVWLPSPDGNDRMLLVEQRGLPQPGRGLELLDEVLSAAGRPDERVFRHMASVPGRAEGEETAQCLTARMSQEGEHFGYITVMKWSGEFSETDGAILAAVGMNIGGSLRSVRLLSEARKLADRDPVTGLFNHRSAYQRLHAEVERCRRDEKPLSVVMMDLDNFKLFNDTYGHPAGDEVLRRVAGVLKRSCRGTDTVARYGGDEFIVILPEAGLKQATRCAERIQAALGKEQFRFQDSSPLPIGFSYGLAVYPDDTTDALELVSVADGNLYQSKSAGGNQITARGSQRPENALAGVTGFDLFWAMVTAIDNKDGYTRKHSEEVTEYSLSIARAMGLCEDTLHTLQVAGILHDVGKIGVPDAVLRKPGHLTADEQAIMQQHPVFGSLIVGAVPGMEQVVLGVRHHHERWDGNGYPDRLSGGAIPLIGRIMAVADAFSAMTTSRPYRKALTERQALKEIRKGLGTQFDPEIGELFIKIREEVLAVKSSTRANGRKADPVPAAAPQVPVPAPSVTA